VLELPRTEIPERDGPDGARRGRPDRGALGDRQHIDGFDAMGIRNVECLEQVVAANGIAEP
jgi:hypothetical protein